MSRRRKSTIYDVAVAADASPTTVSLVLNDSWQRYRIKQETATRILNCAENLGYAINLKARGLRLSQSGLAGMILPHYRNRFFAGLAEAFEANARSRGLCPIVVSTHRNPNNEASVTETLLAQQVEFLFFSGVYNPDPLNDMCRAAGVRCVNIDLPGSRAPSVVSDSRGGARDLSRVVIDKLLARGADISDIFFFGGWPRTTRRTTGCLVSRTPWRSMASRRVGTPSIVAAIRRATRHFACEPLRSARASSGRPLRQRRHCAGGRAALHLYASV